VLDMANDVRLAARRFSFQRRVNIHPVESLEGPRAWRPPRRRSPFLELDDLPTAEQRASLAQALARESSR
jgi:hypothetical protein